MFEAQCSKLKASDPILGQVIERVGACTLRPRGRTADLFSELARAIIGQQISTAAARTIYQRLLDLEGEARLDPQKLLAASEERLRGAGVSRQKAAYLKDLAAKVAGGLPEIAQLEAMEDEAIVEVLTQVKGVGRWTVQMLLIFTFGRLDVLPAEDLGVRKAIRQLYGLEELPRRKPVEAIARSWQPYRSLAAWYLWQSL